MLTKPYQYNANEIENYRTYQGKIYSKTYVLETSIWTMSSNVTLYCGVETTVPGDNI